MKMQGKKSNPYYQGQAILSRRDHSVFEVKTKLKRKGFSENEISQVITKLKQQGLLNDRRFASLLIEETLRSKAVGPHRLTAKLKQKGIATQIISQAIAAKYQPGFEEELARCAAATWRKTHPNHAHDQTRLIRFLASRGFSQSAYSFLDRWVSGE